MSDIEKHRPRRRQSGQSKKITDAKALVSEIARITRERITAQNVISWDDLKTLNIEPHSILVIEDDELMRRTLHRIFEADGYRVHSAKDGMELSQVLPGISVDLIIVDVGLPWINGFELVQLMKGHKDLKSVPVVFVSGFNDKETMKKGFAVGADDFITKPFDVQQVRKTVAALLELSS